MVLTKEDLNEQLDDLLHCIGIYALHLLREPKASKIDFGKAVAIDAIDIWARGIDPKFENDLSHEVSIIRDCIERCGYDAMYDPTATKFDLLSAIFSGIDMWKKGMMKAIKKDEKLK